MPLLDSRGRVFGRWNLIDAGIAIFLLLLLPAGLVIYRVFRVRDPIIVSVEPAVQPPGPGLRIRLKGRDFRPFLRAYVNKAGTPFSLINRTVGLSEGTFLVETPELVEIELPPLQAATYDLYLFDELQQLAERPAAFTISAYAGTLEATVRFAVLPDFAPLVKPGDEDTIEPGGRASEDVGRATLKGTRFIEDKPMTLDLRFPATLAGTPAIQTAGRALEATVLIPARRAANGAWQYKGQNVRAGDALSFQTPRYAMYGVILGVSEASAVAKPGERGASK
jgi:hypothetical protein